MVPKNAPTIPHRKKSENFVFRFKPNGPKGNAATDRDTIRVIRLRYGIEEPALTLEQIASLLEITRERVRQIQVRAEERLKRFLRLEFPSLVERSTNAAEASDDGEATQGDQDDRESQTLSS